MWDESVPIHVASDFYRVNDFLGGESTLQQIDIDEIGDLEGKSLLHLQCHFGLDTLSFARLGAEVTGVDFSEPAIVAARDLSTRAGVPGTFVVSELYDSPVAVDGPFDVVYVNVGALCWLPEIKGWADVVAGFLKPGGVFYMREIHPIVWTLDDEVEDQRLVIRFPYFEREAPLRWDGQTDYAEPAARLSNTVSYEWNHGLGEIISALITAGLTIEFVHELDWTVSPPLPFMVETEPGVYRLPEDRERLPLQYTLRARRA